VQCGTDAHIHYKPHTFSVYNRSNERTAELDSRKQRNKVLLPALMQLFFPLIAGAERAT
jgi:hypothetical protein